LGEFGLAYMQWVMCNSSWVRWDGYDPQGQGFSSYAVRLMTMHV
jgi:hypothetical protein